VDPLKATRSDHQDRIERQRRMTTGMEVPMLGSLGLSETLQALIVCWLAAQLPLGMLIGSALRRATLLSTVEAKQPQPRMSWSEFLPVAPRVL
jgi:hypothetical protein